MAITNFIPQVWTARLLQDLEKQVVYGSVVNANYEGDVVDGSSVRIGKLTSDITITNYTKNTDLGAAQLLNDSALTLSIDQQKAFNFYVDDIDKVQSRPDIMGEAMRKAAIAISQEVDEFLAATLGAATLPTNNLLTSSTNSNSSIIGNSSGWHSDMIKLRRLASEANIARDAQLTMIVPPVFVQGLNEWQSASGRSTGPSAGVFVPSVVGESLVNGFIGRLYGINIVESNNVPTITADSKVNDRCFMLTQDALTMARQISTIEAYRPDGRFGDAVKGLYTYGALITDPSQVFELRIPRT